MSKASAVVMVYAVSGVPAAAVVLTAIDVSGVPAVTRVSAVAAIPTYVDVPSAIVGVSNDCKRTVGLLIVPVPFKPHCPPFHVRLALNLALTPSWV